MKNFKELKSGDLFIAKLNDKHEAYDEDFTETFHAMKIVASNNGDFKEYIYNLYDKMAFDDIECYDVVCVIEDENE